MTMSVPAKALHIRDSDRLTILLDAIERGNVRVFLDSDENEASVRELEQWLDGEVERARLDCESYNGPTY